MRKILTPTLCVCATASVLALVGGCATDNTSSKPATPAATTPAAPVTPAATTPTPAATAPAAGAPAKSDLAGPDGIIRIKAGQAEDFKDSAGHVWKGEASYFSGGDDVTRDASTVIANTKDSALYLDEHYGMDSFSIKVPNGKYIAKLYFAETYDGISGPGDRIFSYNVQGHAFKDFDIWAKTGGMNKAYVETVPVEVTNGTFKIDFTTQTQNPEINAIELDPGS